MMNATVLVVLLGNRWVQQLDGLLVRWGQRVFQWISWFRARFPVAQLVFFVAA